MSAPVTTIRGTAYPWGVENVDTDVIIPAHWMKTTSRIGLGRGAFETVRSQPGNLFDDRCYAGSPILIAGDNFGCGSSREHAVWALADMGVGAIVAPSFSDIFSGNAFKNGIVTVVLPQAAIDQLLDVARSGNLTVDLESMTVTTDSGDRFEFHLDPFRRECLMLGLDEIGITLERGGEIARFEDRLSRCRPWVGLDPAPSAPSGHRRLTK